MHHATVQIGLGHCGEQTYLFLKLKLDFFAKFVSEFLEVWRLGLCGNIVCCLCHASPDGSLEFVVFLHFAGDDAELSIADTLILQGFGDQLIDRVPFSVLDDSPTESEPSPTADLCTMEWLRLYFLATCL